MTVYWIPLMCLECVNQYFYILPITSCWFLVFFDVDWTSFQKPNIVKMPLRGQNIRVETYCFGQPQNMQKRLNILCKSCYPREFNIIGRGEVRGKGTSWASLVGNMKFKKLKNPKLFKHQYQAMSGKSHTSPHDELQSKHTH